MIFLKYCKSFVTIVMTDKQTS